MLRAGLTEGGQKAGLGRQAAVQRLADHRRQLGGVAGDQGDGGLGVVEGSDEDVGPLPIRHAAAERFGLRKGQKPAAE